MVKVTAAVLERNGKFLICRRPLSKQLGGLWEFPGGKLEPNETLEDCLRRELWEELGIRNASIGELLGTYRSEHIFDRIELYAFLVPYPSGEIELLDHDEARWINLDDYNLFSFAPLDSEIIATLRQRTNLI